MAVRDIIRRKLTYEDYVLIPEDGLRHEILDGEHYMSPAPTPEHQGIAAILFRKLDNFVHERRLGRVYFAPLDIYFSPHDIAQPDLLFISNERAGIVGKKKVEGAPDLLVEVLSDSTRRTDQVVKQRIYEAFGVLEYWLVNLQDRTVRVYRRAGDGFGPAATLSGEAGDVLTTPLLPGLEIRVGEIFE
ncbi:MAG TPA: Uma2 family endonuclease [Thermoanaerobaculia bacterium]|nr:Uma2 family endonuclease [Thermoanaerobaculia bacterium]